jgi:hypothetical protein
MALPILVNFPSNCKYRPRVEYSTSISEGYYISIIKSLLFRYYSYCYMLLLYVIVKRNWDGFETEPKCERSPWNLPHRLVLISSTLYARVFRTNNVSAAFSSYMYVTCTWKKLPKWRSCEKFVRKNVDEIHTDSLSIRSPDFRTFENDQLAF